MTPPWWSYRRPFPVLRARRSKRPGARAGSRTEIDSLLVAGALEELPDSNGYWIVRRGARGVLTPAMGGALEQVGLRFHARFDSMGLPPYRFEITSGLRTGDEQAAPRQSAQRAS